MNGGCKTDAREHPCMAQPRPLAAPVLLAENGERLADAGIVVAAVVIAAGRRLAGKFVSVQEIAPAQLDGIDPELARDAIHQAFEREDVLLAAVAAVKASRQLVGEDAACVDFSVR